MANFWKFLRPFYWKAHPKESISSKIIFHEFWGVTQTVKLENSSRPNVACNIWSQSKNRMDEFSSKTFCVTPQNWKKLNRSKNSWFLMDGISSKTACLTARKMKISEKISGWVFHDLPIRVNSYVFILY